MRNPYPNFVWFFGVAEDTSEDPLRLGRVRVRAVGFHPSTLEKEKLPWAPVLNGGTAKIKSGQMVLGFFLDGEEAQQPCILGTIGGAVTGSDFVDSQKKSGSKSVSEAPEGERGGETYEEPVSRVVASENKTVRVLELQGTVATTRIYPLSSRLKQVLETAAVKANLFVVVTSGGQPAAPGGPRVGSTRHDNGNAADFDLYYPDPANPKLRGTQQLFSSNGGDLERIKKFLKEAKLVGAKGIGHGPGYMAPGRTHVDVVGEPKVWGSDYTRMTAPSWLKNL
jgi:hypothetical protein